MIQENKDVGVPPSGSSHSAKPEPQSVSAQGASVPNAEQFAAIEKAAQALLDRCLLADAHEDLSFWVDGSHLDALREALEWRHPEIWTQEQVDALTAFQYGYGHAFTCGSGNRSDEAHTAYADEHGEDKGQLIATTRGWICPVCDYRQFWAHDFMFDGAMPSPLDWFAAQGMAAPSGGETGTDSTKGNSPVSEADAPSPSTLGDQP